MGDYSSAEMECNTDDYRIDMRSDTQSKPTQAMKDAMAVMTMGDAIYAEDLTCLELEKKIAKMFGKEAATFVPSGTMGNLLGISCHCQTRGLEVIMGDKSHTYLMEQGGISQFCGLHARSIQNNPDGTFDLRVLEDTIRPTDDINEPCTGLIVVENTHNLCGGKALPLNFLPSVRQIADKHGIPIHLDGSRILNASVAQNVPVSELAKCADSINFCLSKGVGAPIGSVLIGTKSFIAKAIRMKKAIGGSWRKAGGLAAAALIGIEDAEERMKRDHANAKLLAQVFATDGKGVFEIDVAGVHTNIVIVEVIKDGVTAQGFFERLARVTEKERQENSGSGTVVRALKFGPRIVRFVMYSTLNDDDIKRAIEKVRFIIREYKSL